MRGGGIKNRMVKSFLKKSGLVSQGVVFAASLLFFACGVYGKAFKGIEVRRSPSLPGEHAHGYRGVEFLVVNRGMKSRNVTLCLRSKSGYYNHITTISKSFTISAGGMIKAKFHQPALDLSQPVLDMVVDGYFAHDIPDVHISSDSINRWDKKPILLVTKTIPGDISKLFDKIKKTDEVEYFRTDVPVEEWGGDWLDLSRYDGILLDKRDMDDMPNAVKRALTAYVKLGGSVCRFSTPSPKVDCQKLKGGGLSYRNDGFGVWVFSTLNPEELDGPAVSKLFSVWKESQDSLCEKVEGNLDSAAKMFQVMKDVKVPVRMLLSIMIIYSFLLGPITLFLLHRKNKRIHILWISPIAAVIFLVIIIVFALFSEGLANRVKKNSLTLLDENNHSAMSLAVVGFYCPIAPDHLDFSASTEVQKIHSSRFANRGYGMDWSVGQRLDGNWTRSRIPAIFYLRKAEMRRERLKVIRTATGIEVVNGLGATIKSLYLIDFDGKRYHASQSVAPGAKIALLPNVGKVSKAPFKFRGVFVGNWLSNLNIWNQSARLGAEQVAPVGGYCAKLDHSPFVESGLESQGELSENCVVVGRLADLRYKIK